jgi:hypothetical protein
VALPVERTMPIDAFSTSVTPAKRGGDAAAQPLKRWRVRGKKSPCAQHLARRAVCECHTSQKYHWASPDSARQPVRAEPAGSGKRAAKRASGCYSERIGLRMHWEVQIATAQTLQRRACLGLLTCA